MAQKRVTDWGRKFIANGAGGLGAPDVRYKLFKTNITPTQDDTDGTYAGAEADFSGYAASGSIAWTAAVTSGELAVLLGAAVTYTVAPSPSVTNNIYGYFAIDHGSGHVLWAMRFDGAPLAMNAAGLSIQITPELDVASQYA